MNIVGFCSFVYKPDMYLPPLKLSLQHSTKTFIQDRIRPLQPPHHNLDPFLFDPILSHLHLESQGSFAFVDPRFVLCKGFCILHLAARLARPRIFFCEADSGAQVLAPVPLDREGVELRVQSTAQVVDGDVGYAEG